MKKVRAALGFIGSGFIILISQVILMAAAITKSTLLLKLAANVWFDGADEYLYCCSLIGAKPDEKIDEMYTVLKQLYDEI